MDSARGDRVRWGGNPNAEPRLTDILMTSDMLSPTPSPPQDHFDKRCTVLRGISILINKRTEVLYHPPP